MLDPQYFDQVKRVAAFQSQIKKHQIGLELLDEAFRVRRVIRDSNAGEVRLLVDKLLEAIAQHRMILNYTDARLHLAFFSRPQLYLSSIIIPIRPVKMLSESQMCLSRFRAQAANGLHGCFRQLKTGFGVIETEEVNPVMRSSQQIIGNHERRVARHSLLKQLHG